MKALNLNTPLRREITEFFITTNTSLVMQGELEDFIKKQISQTYRVLCSMYIFKDSISNNLITK